MIKEHVKLPASDKQALLRLQKQTGLHSKVFKRVTVLLELNNGKTITEIMEMVGLSYPTVSSLIDRYNTIQLDCLQDKK